MTHARRRFLILAAVLFVAALPQRANVELLTMYPTEQRDWTAELR